jgi:hypothetical protein
MKKSINLILFFLLTISSFSQSVAINNNAIAAHASAMLDISSTSKGLLVPRMSSIQRNQIPNPANGLLLYDTDANAFLYYNGSSWNGVAAGGDNAAWKGQGNAGTTAGYHFIGTTDQNSLMFRTNNTLTGLFDYWRKNYFIGESAGLNNNGGSGTGSFNIAIGFSAFRNNTIKHRTIAIGDSALFSNGIGADFNANWAIQNLAIGSKALYANTIGSGNMAIGFNALTDNISGNSNVAIGVEAMTNSTGGDNNTSVGYWSLHNNISGDLNSVYGYNAMSSNTTGSLNTALGVHALRLNTTGVQNIAVGYKALNNNNNGNWNTAVGHDALGENVDGYENVGIGYHALYTNHSGNNNTALGFGADVGNDNLVYATAIGSGAEVECSNCLVLGGIGAEKTKVGINTTTPAADLHFVQQSDASGNNTRGLRIERSGGVQWRVYVDILNNLTFEFNNNGSGNWGWVNAIGTFVSGSDQRIKKDVKPMESSLAKIMQLQPKTYHYSKQAADEPLQFGFMAQEVEKLFPEFISTREDGIKGIAYQNFGVVAIKAIQEQQDQLAKQQQIIDELKKQNESILERLKTLEQRVSER